MWRSTHAARSWPTGPSRSCAPPAPTPLIGRALLARIERDLYGDPDAGNHWWNHLALALRNNRHLRQARRLNPLWWARRLRVRGIDLIHHHATNAADVAKVVADLDGEPIGRLTYQLCRPCHAGFVCKISVDDEYQGLGLGNRLIGEALRAGPPADGYTWVTTMQYDTATGFWRTLGHRHRASFAEAEGNRAPCPHMG